MTAAATKIPALPALLDQDLSFIQGQLRSELTELAGRRILITGGAGFLGYYLVQALDHWNRSAPSADRIAITVFDNLKRGEPRWLTDLAAGKRLTLARHDMREPLPADMAAFEYIIHAAGIASPTFYRRFPIETMDANINGLRALLEYARARQESADPVRGFLFFSSSEIYGDPPAEWIPTPEHYRGNVSCTGPRACYDESKRYGETLCVEFARVYGLPITAARPFNNFGPGLKISDRRVIPDFAADILAGRDIVLLSDGKPSRTFCYVADAVAGYHKVLVRGRPGEAYNIGIETPEITMAELAARMVEIGRELVGYSGKVVLGASAEAAYLEDNPARRCPSIQKAREHIGYAPAITLDEGLRRSFAWYTHHRQGSDA
ncbi:MAG: NAD-dependent epimerase/dehydratase family protein [Gemmatimonadales bacterium]|nr:NAD-dependent epimerase/dehydratase family protein [Gemmatimonadales bacterium]